MLRFPRIGFLKAIGAALIGASFVSCSHATPTPASNQVAELPTVVVLSFDALAYRFIDRDALPNFRRMMAEGVRAPFRPEFPSKTFPNHYSMATGLTPGQHGIVLNQFYDATRRAMFSKAVVTDGSWFGGEPIWVTAEKAGILTGAYFWTGTEGVVDGHRPTYFHLFDATIPDSVKIVEVMGWLRRPTSERPHLVMIYSPIVDIPGHKYGPDGKETYAGVSNADRTIGVLRDSLRKLSSLRVDLIIVSDHGLSYVPLEHDIDLDPFIPKKGAIVDNEHATFALWQDPAGPRLNLDSIAAEYRKIPHTRVFMHDEFPAEWHTEHNPRFGDIFLLADAGWEYETSVPHTLPTIGEHGFDPATPDMMGTFIAAGPDFKSGLTLPVRENRTLHDLLVRLLRLASPFTTTESEFGLKR
jgi:predicted AlkP superfamily pyrophosphatase or phosphodiesterase